MGKMLVVPISIKGIVIEDNKVWLRKNERDEWELPGGKLDESEQPEETVARELKEELGFEVEVENIIQAHLYKIKSSSDESQGVLVVTYLCELTNKVGDFEINGEWGKAKFEKFSLDEIKDLKMPQFYKEAISKAFSLKETTEILADPGLLRAIKTGEKDILKRRTYKWDKVKKDLV